MPEPIVEPLRIVAYLPSTSSSAQITRRIPSGWEALKPRQRRWGSCHDIGHTRASLRCPVKMRHAREEFRAESAIQIAPGSASQFIPRAIVSDILDSAGQSSLKSALQSVLNSGDQLIPKSIIQSILESITQPNPKSAAQPSPESVSQLNPRSADTRPIWLGRPELIHKLYLPEKQA